MFKGIRKARIQKGFPKIARLLVSKTTSFPIKYAYYPSYYVSLKANEIVVLVGDATNYRGDSLYRYIPLGLLAAEIVPINCALTWASRVSSLPTINPGNVEILS